MWLLGEQFLSEAKGVVAGAHRESTLTSHRTTELNSTVDLRLKVNTDEVSTTITEESEESKGNYNREPPEGLC